MQAPPPPLSAPLLLSPLAAFCPTPPLPFLSNSESNKSSSSFSCTPIFSRPRCSSHHHDNQKEENQFKHLLPSPVHQSVPSPSRRQFILRLLSLPLISSAVLNSKLTFADVENPSTPISTSISTSTSPAPPSSPPPAPAPTSTSNPKWSYTSPTGPASWSDLSPDYITASTGQNQSPIPLSYRSATTVSKDVKRPTLTTTPSTFAFKLRELQAAANPSLTLDLFIPPPPPVVGDAPPLDLPTPPPPPAFVQYDGTTFAFRTMHVHVNSSEHVIDNNPGIAEFHFIFERRQRAVPPPPPPPPSSSSPTDSSSSLSPSTDTKTKMTTTTTTTTSTTNLTSNSQEPSTSPLPLASPPSFAQPASAEESESKPQTLVIALLAKKDTQSVPWVDTLLSSFLEKSGQDGRGPGILIDLDMANMLSEFNNTDLFVYSGSLTTPPCTEGVVWIVMRAKCPMALTDIATISRLQNGPNVRPLQPTNNRKVLRFLPAPST